MSSIFTKSFLILLKAVKAARGGKYVHREFAGTFTDKKGKIRNKWHYFRNQGTLQQELAAWKAKFEAKQAKQKRNLFATPADIKGVEQTKPIRNEKLADRKKRIAKVLANPVALESAKQETLKLIQQHREIKEQPKQTSVARFNDSGVKFRESSVKGLYDARNPHNDKEIFVIYERPNGYELKFGSESKGIFTDLKSLNDAIKTKVQDTKDILDMLERETPTSPKVEPVQAKTFDEHIAHLNLSDSQKKAALDLLNSLKKDTPEFAKTRIERFKTMPGSYRAVGEAVASYFEQGNSLSDAMLGNQNAKKDVVAELNPESEVKKYSNGISIKTITKDGKVYRKLKLSNLNKSFDMDERVRKLILSGDLKRISNSLNKNKFSKNEFVIPESSYENVINGLGIVEKKNKADQPKEELSIDDKRVVSLEKEFDKDIDSGMDSISLFNKFKDKANVIKVVYSEKVNRYGLDLFTKDDPDYGIGFIQMVPSKLKDFLSKNYPAQYNQLQNYLDNPNKDLMHIGIVKDNFDTMPDSIAQKSNILTLLKGKKAQEGEVRTWGNGRQYKKVGGKWQPVNEGKKKAEPKQKKERKKKGSTESNTGFSMKPFAEIKRIAQYTKEADFDKEKIEQYKNSIAEHGYDPAFPMVIDKDKRTGAYNVVAGNHRYKAVEALISEGKLPKDFEIPTVMREFEDENARLAYQVRENQRRDPLPTDEANAYKKMADNGWDAARIAKELGQPVGKITKRLALSNLSPDLFNLVSKKGIPVGIAEAIGLGSVEEESGKPNHTIQLKAYQFYRDNKGKGYGAGEVLSFIRELKSNASQKFFENDGKSDTEKEALRSVGSEEKAKRNVKMLDNTFKSISKALSNLMGDSVGQINPKLAKELSASIVAAQGESEFGIKMKQLDTVIQDMQLMKEAFMKSFKGMKDDSTMGMMFASSINTMIHSVNKHTKAIETAKAINKMLSMAYKAKYKLHDQSVKARLAA